MYQSSFDAVLRALSDTWSLFIYTKCFGLYVENRLKVERETGLEITAVVQGRVNKI